MRGQDGDGLERRTVGFKGAGAPRKVIEAGRGMEPAAFEAARAIPAKNN